MSDDCPFDDEAVGNLIAYFAERLNLVFAYFFCVLEFEGDEDFTAQDLANNHRAWTLSTIRDACMHTTLLAIRDLDDVLMKRHRDSRPDDLKVSDFGYPASLAFLAKSERDDINKRIAHSTHLGSQGPDHRWDIFELATKAVNQSLVFLDWVAKKHSLHQFNTWTSAVFCAAKTRAIYKSVAAEIDERKARQPTKSQWPKEPGGRSPRRAG